MKTALISGITGQDGSYLAELLVSKGYAVHGIVRRSSQFNRSRIDHLRAKGAKLFLHYANLYDQTSIRRIFVKVQPDEFYHLAGQSHVGLSFEIPESTTAEIAVATLGILEICRDLEKKPRIFHASSSEIFGDPTTTPQTEETPFKPINPYGCGKTFSTNICQVYRKSHGMFIVNGILYNHESPRRGENFVTKKIVDTAIRIADGSDEILELGNLSATRDWGWAPDYVDGFWRSLQHDTADDYVFATGVQFSVREFAEAAFAAAGKEIKFSGNGLDEIARCKVSEKTIVRVNSNFFRPSDQKSLVGDANKAKKNLDWQPTISGIRLSEKLIERTRLRQKEQL